MDDGALLFDTREELQTAKMLIHSHFLRLGLQMHMGTDSIYLDSKSEAVVFPAPGIKSSSLDTSPVSIGTLGYIMTTDKFKYLGSYLAYDHSDTYDVKLTFHRQKSTECNDAQLISKSPFAPLCKNYSIWLYPLIYCFGAVKLGLTSNQTENVSKFFICLPFTTNSTLI